MEKQKNKATEIEINDDALKNVSGGTETDMGTEQRCQECGELLTKENEFELSLCDKCIPKSRDPLFIHLVIKRYSDMFAEE